MQNVSLRKKTEYKLKSKRRTILSRKSGLKKIFLRNSGSPIVVSSGRRLSSPSLVDNLKSRLLRKQYRHQSVGKLVWSKSRRSNNCYSVNNKEYPTSSPVYAAPSPFSSNTTQQPFYIQSNLMAELFESEDEEVSEVESFILEHGDLDEEPVLDTSKLLLSAEGADSPDLHSMDAETRAVLEAAGITLGDTHEVDAESRERLEALLEAAGKHIIDPEVLRRLTSSVSCALDEAAAALTRMRNEQQNGPTTSSSSSSLCNSSKQHSSQQHSALDAVAAAVVDGSSLIDACNDGNLEVVRRLLDEGRNVNEMTEEGESLLSLACSSGYYELAQLLLATRANVEDRGLKDTTPLMEAASAGHTDIVKLLLAHGADVNAQTSQGNTPLMYVCAAGHEDIVRILLEAGANVEDHNENGHTPLMEAASAGHVGVAKILVEHGASINTHSNEFKESALTLACYKGHLEMVRFLLEAGADQEHKTEEMHTALMEASMDGHVEVARLLLDSGAQVNMPADSFESPLTLAACGGHVELAMLLLERGANIEEVNDEGYTPLMEAAREGHEEMVALLLSQAADINAQTEETQETALTLACCGGFLEVADFLIKAGADIEAGANTPLMEAAQEGHIDLVKHLINCGANVNATTASGDTALMYACENGHTDVAEILLNAGGNLEHEAEGGRTPLMKAARAGHLCTVQFLVSKGANVNKVTANNDHTPLSLACAGGHFVVVQFLLAHGADPTHRLKDNSTMLIEASKGGHTNVVQLLIDYPNTAKSPPPSDVSSLNTTNGSTNAGPDVCDNTASRVPPHGLQACAESDHHMSSSNQRKSSVTSSGSTGKHGFQKGSSRSKSNCNKTMESVEPYVPLPKSRSNSNSTKHLERSLSDSSASHLLSSLTSAASSSEVSSSTGQQQIDALKETERLEQCINNMMKRTEMLNPSREEQILQKQQILEELQRVERELQEKAQAQLLLTHQAQQQQQLIQSLCYQAGLSSNAISSAVQPSSATVSVSTTSEQEQQLTNVPSQAMWLLDMSTLKQQLKTGEGLSYQMPSTLSSTPTAMPTTTGLDAQSSQAACSHGSDTLLNIDSLSTSSSSDVSVSQTNTLNCVSPVTSSSCSRPRNKQTTKVKNTVMKLHQCSAAQSSPQSMPEDVEKMNLRNVLNNDHQHVPTPSNTHSASQLQQQQLLLSELARNFTANCRQEEAEALQFLQQTAENVKFEGSLPFLIPPLFDLNSLNQVSMQQSQQPQPPPQQQQTQSTQTLISSLPEVFENFKKQTALLAQQASQSSCSSAVQASDAMTVQPQDEPLIQQNHQTHPQQQQQTSQSTQTTDLQLSDAPMAKHIATKPNKPVKSGSKNSQAHTQSQVNQITQTNAALLPSLTSQQLQVLKNQLAAAAAAAAASQQTSPSEPCNVGQALQFNTSTGVVITGAASTNGAYGTLLPTSSMFALGAPAFPVTLSLTPTTVSTTVTTSSTATVFPQPITLETGDGTASSFLLTPQRTLPDGSVGGFSIAGTTASQNIASACFETLNFSTNANNMTMFTNTVTSLPVGIEPISFPTIPVSSVLTTTSLNQQKQSSAPASTECSVTSCPVSTLSKTNLDQLQEPQATVTQCTASSISGTCTTNSSPTIMVTVAGTSTTTTATATTSTSTKPNSAPSPPPWYPPLDLDSKTDSNHDTALTLACAGGHEELVQLLLNRGANMEHRDKKGFTPLMLAATAGHANVCETLLNNNSDIEAQSERTKDTALSLACSSGRYEVVELLLSRGANKEHRNVSDYTPLSLAASGGYVNIIKLLLSHGAEINSRTGSKLGISPLMLAAMNGHAATVKLLLDMGSDINAQIETNRNTALTLACFQGRCEVVSLLLDRKANVEHRAKTGLTPLMEAASGGYVEVGRILLDKGADVNAPPVPSSRDTALTIAADKGHYRFVELLLQRGAQVDVKNKKGSSPLWLACNGGHLDVVQLLVNAGADIDSQDNRKVSCLMAAFRKGHVKVVKWMVKHVTQFPSDHEMTRYLALINDKELLKKCNQCMDIIRQAKDKQAAEANKNATILLEEIDMERSREESRKLAAARRRERKRQKKREKQEQLKAAKNAQDSKEKKKDKHNSGIEKHGNEKLKEDSDSDSDDDGDESLDDDDGIDDPIPRALRESPVKEAKLPVKQQAVPKKKESDRSKKITIQVTETSSLPSQSSSKLPLDKKDDKQSHVAVHSQKSKHDGEDFTACKPVAAKVTGSTNSHTAHEATGKPVSVANCASEVTTVSMNKKSNNWLNELTLDVPKDLEKNLTSQKSPSSFSTRSSSSLHAPVNLSAASQVPLQNKKPQKREEGWKEVVRRSKKVSVPANAISRVIGRGGSNINTVREISGAHIEVEKQKGQGDRQIIIKGSADATRHAQQLINGLVNEPDKDLLQIIAQLGLNRPSSVNGDEPSLNRGPVKSSSATVMNSNVSRVVLSSGTGVTKSASGSSVFITSTSASNPGSTTAPFASRSSGVVPVRPAAPVANIAPPFGNSNPVVSQAWSSSKLTLPPRMLASVSSSGISSQSSSAIGAKTTISYTMAMSNKAKTTTKSAQSTVVTSSKVVTNSEGKPGGVPFVGSVRPSSQPFITTNRLGSSASPVNKTQNQTISKPFSNNSISTAASSGVTTTTTTATTAPEYTPFNNLFSKVAQQTVWGKDTHKPNFASVAASGISSVASSQQVTSITSSLTIPMPSTSEAELTVDASKAPGYRGNLHVSPSNASLSSTPSSSTGSNFGPIGTGPRSAPCTPPLLGMSSTSNRYPSPTSSSTAPTTPPPSCVNRSGNTIPDNNTFTSNEMHIISSNSYSVQSTATTTTYQTSAANLTTGMASQGKTSNFNLAPGSNPTRSYTNTTFSQHVAVPLSSVGQIHPPGSVTESSNTMSNTAGGTSSTLQSSLNPNAPDFSSRSASSFGNQQPNGHNVRTTTNQHQQRSLAFQDVIPNPQLQMQMRAAILAAGASLQMQTLQAQAAQAAQAVQNQARFQYGVGGLANAAALHQHHQPNVAAAAAAAAAAGVLSAPPDFNPPSAETLRLLHTAISAFPSASAAMHVGGSIQPPAPQNLQQFNLIQPTVNVRQQTQRAQPNNLNAAVTNMNAAVAKDCETSGEMHEERKLPRPIGTERAQKKNPVYGLQNSTGTNASVDLNQGTNWPFPDAGAESVEWMQPDPTGFSSTRNFRAVEEISNDQIDHAFMGNPMNTNVTAYSTGNIPLVNGVPAHMMTPHLYHPGVPTSTHVANMGATVPEAADYWTGKMPNIPGLNNGLSNQTSDSKLSWQTWNQHQT